MIKYEISYYSRAEKELNSLQADEAMKIMDAQTLENLIKQGEGKTLEFKLRPSD